MSFRDRAKPPNPSKIVLPITPMLDLTFQLLFFFIINFRSTPAMMEGQIDMALPSENVTASKSPTDKPEGAEKDKIDFPADITVKVRTQLDGINDGDISAIAVRNDAGKETPVDGGLKGLTEELKKVRETLPQNQKNNIKVQGDGKLKVKSLMKVMDACRAAGFENTSMVPPEDFGR